MIGARWIIVEQESEPWRPAHVPFVEFAATRPPGESGPVVSGYDGCNWYGVNGTLDGDRLTFVEGSSTAQDCGPGHEVAGLGGGRLRLTDDGTTLEVYDGGVDPRLVFLRLDSLSSADATRLSGRWRLDPATPAEIVFDADGTMTIGACTWSWSLDEQLTVGELPEDPYACLGADIDQTSGRLVELLVGGPVDARLDGDGGVYLTDDQFVFRLASATT